MGFLDNILGKAQRAVEQHGDKITRGIDQAASAADRKTRGKYSGHIGTGSSKAKEALERLNDKRGGDTGPTGRDGGRR